jgi:hypothetical protein
MPPFTLSTLSPELWGAWITSRLKHDQARHAGLSAALAVPLAFLPWLPWAQALAAGAVVSLWELVQHYRGEGDASWDDVAANFGGAGLVALGALA